MHKTTSHTTDHQQLKRLSETHTLYTSLSQTLGHAWHETFTTGHQNIQSNISVHHYETTSAVHYTEPRASSKINF